MAPPPLPALLDTLRDHYGAPEPPPVTRAFEQILWDSCAYLVNDSKRAQIFAALRSQVGLTPEAILKASDEELYAVTRMGGMHPEARAEKLRECAELVRDEFAGDLDQVLTWPLPKAKKALRAFWGVGEPGAEKILLFAQSYPLLALESNGVRALTRLGYVREQKSYSATYKALQAALADQIVKECDWLIGAYQLLRRHGQELCKNTNPLCGGCPVKGECEFGRGR